MMKELAREFPRYETPLLALCERAVDLLRLIRGSYYHPDFYGSFSIKSVLPALVPDLAYDDLEIPEGLAATAAYARLIAGGVPQSEEAKNQGVATRLLRKGHRGNGPHLRSAPDRIQ